MNPLVATERRATARLVACLGVVVLVAAPFFLATTFIGDDHVFLAFARHAPHPFVPFYADQHGGEYYRPLPMLVWWLLGRLGAGSAPFAALALGLHALAALLAGRLLWALNRPPAVAAGAAALMFLAPQNLEAAYWFSASTDLFATVFTLAALVALVRGRGLASLLAALGAYFSKEAAFVLPLLALIVVPGTWRRRFLAIVPHAVALAAVIALRLLVLHGGGGGSEERAGLVGKALQLVGGFARIFTGEVVFPQVLAFGLGTTVIALAALAAYRRSEARLAPFAFAALAAAPLVAAGWAVGARYYYLPAVGIVWAAAEALAAAGTAARLTLAAVLLLVGGGQAARRRGDIVSYRARVAAAQRAVGEGGRLGHRVFHIDGGIKDLDLAVKESAQLGPLASEVLVLNDVPASFAIVPPPLAAAAALVVAQPPLPPSGAYRFGDVRVVGLARRGDEPSLAEVVASFPDIRFIRLRPTSSGRILARDLTDDIKRRLDGSDEEGQN